MIGTVITEFRDNLRIGDKFMLSTEDNNVGMKTVFTNEIPKQLEYTIVRKNRWCVEMEYINPKNGYRHIYSPSYAKLWLEVNKRLDATL